MKLIVGLGNPEEKYDHTRHNIGFAVLDAYVQKNSTVFQRKDKFRAQIASLENNEKILLIKPTTYYNLIGESVQSLMNFYQISPDNLLVIHDEIALRFCTLRTRRGGSSAGNNGIKSIISHIGPDFWRLRIGTANDKLGLMNSADFVLNRFTLDETAKLVELENSAHKIIDKFIKNDLDPTTSKLDIDEKE